LYPFYWNGQLYQEAALDVILRRDSGAENLPDEVREILELHKNEIRDPRLRARMAREIDLGNAKKR